MLRYNPDEDHIWVSKLRNDDEAAFKILFDAYKDDVFTYALSFLNHKEFAEEIVQEAFTSFLTITGTSLPTIPCPNGIPKSFFSSTM